MESTYEASKILQVQYVYDCLHDMLFDSQNEVGTDSLHSRI